MFRHTPKEECIFTDGTISRTDAKGKRVVEYANGLREVLWGDLKQYVERVYFLWRTTRCLFILTFQSIRGGWYGAHRLSGWKQGDALHGRSDQGHSREQWRHKQQFTRRQS